MNSIKAFFKEKGRYLFCLALVFAATVAGILGLRTVIDAVQGLGRPATGQEERGWNETEPNTTVNNPATNVPEESDAASKDAKQDVQAGPAASSAPSSPSSASSASGGASAAAGGSAASSAPQATLPTSPWAAKPAVNFSGDELVYQETLGDWRTHNGADYTVTAGADVPPAVPGTVLSVQEDALWGGVVEIAAKDGGLWRYCGLTDIRVKQDDKVTAATVLGKAGDIPAEQHLGAHLHLECTRDGAYLDPESKK